MYSYRAKCFNEMYSFAMKTYGVNELVTIPWMKYHKGEAYYNAAAEPIIARTFPRALRNGLLETATPPEKERAATEPMDVRGFLKWHARSLLDPTMNPLQYVNVMMEKISGDTSRVDGLTADQLSRLSDRALRRYCDDLVDFEIEFCLQNVSMMWIAPYLMNSLAHMVDKWAGMGPETFGALVTGNPERSATSDENLWLWRLARKLHADQELRALFAENPDGAFFAAAENHPTGQSWLAEYRGVRRGPPPPRARRPGHLPPAPLRGPEHRLQLAQGLPHGRRQPRPGVDRTREHPTPRSRVRRGPHEGAREVPGGFEGRGLQGRPRRDHARVRVSRPHAVLHRPVYLLAAARHPGTRGPTRPARPAGAAPTRSGSSDSTRCTTCWRAG